VSLRAVFRRHPRLAVGGIAALAAVTLAGAVVAQALNQPRVVRIVAERYDYDPDVIVLKKGEPVVLDLVARDRPHGFHVPALGIRADLMPGQEARIPVTPARAGRFVFVCDLFCGSGHDDMGGAIKVVD
jgi:cytochrome c oxidase subunit 2